MQKTLQIIDQEVREDSYISDICRENWEERKKELKRKEKEFVEEIVKDNPELIKKVRVEYLEQKFDNLNKEYIKRYNEAQEYRNKFPVHNDMEDLESSLCFVYNMFADLIEHEESFSRTVGRPPNIIRIFSLRFLPEIAREIKKTGFNIYVWNNPDIFWDDNKITEEQIEMARKADCADFIEAKRISGDKKIALCPFHEDHRPSLTLYPDGKGYYCFSCSAHGNAIDLVMKLYNLNFVDAVRLILKN